MVGTDCVSWDRINCPASGCNEFFQYEDVKKLLSAEDFNR